MSDLVLILHIFIPVWTFILAGCLRQLWDIKKLLEEQRDKPKD